MTKMIIPTDSPITPSSFLGGNFASRPPDREEKFKPVEKKPRTTFPSDPDLASGIRPTTGHEPHKEFDPPLARLSPLTGADSIPIQIWEGTVTEVDRANDTMQVVLDAKMGQIPRHAGEIELQWVAEQDQDLVRPGAVFYLTLFKRTKRGSIENSQELRFRRRPSWSAEQLRQVKKDAEMFLSKMRPPLPAK